MNITKHDFGIFAVILLVIYYIVPKKFQWFILLLGSGYFYYNYGIGPLIFLSVTAIFTYGAGLLIDFVKSKNKEKKDSKSSFIIMLLAVLIFSSLLVVMRVSSFSSIVAPMGLSFYSLMCMGYVIDVHREAVPAEKNPLRLALFISYFPHIIQGPFDDYKELSDKLKAPHYFNYEKAVMGSYRIMFGIIKKRVIADRISNNIIDGIYADPTGYHGFVVIITMILYAIQLYCDFSGYMDIACGVSMWFDIDIKENFDVPFLSKSMAEFWRRWHISLGLWFKNYVFYPVQRTELCNKIRKAMKKKNNRYGMKVFPSCLGLVCVWTLIGLWHGFDLNYLFYDWFCGLVIIFSELMGPVYDKINGLMPRFSKSKFADILRVVRTFIIVAFSFLIFRSPSLSDFWTLFTSIFAKFDFVKGAEFIYWHAYDCFILAPAIIALIIVDIMKYRGIDVSKKIHSLPWPLRYAGYILVPLYFYVCKCIMTGISFAYSIF